MDSPANNTVAIVRCPDYDPAKVQSSIRRAVGLLGGMGSFVRPGDRVLVKPNMLTAKPPEKAVTTHPEVVRAILRLVKEAGGAPFIGDSHAIGGFARVSEVTGIAQVARDEGVKLIELSEAVEVKGEGRFKRFELSADAVRADRIINLPKVKTHGQMLLTLAVKNLFGLIPGRRKAQWHFKAGVDRNAFATMLVELHGLVKPALSVADGVVGMEGNGPGNGTPRELGLIAASSDAFALDYVLSEILGVNADTLLTNRVARKMGLAPDNLSDIGLLGDFGTIREAVVKGFKLPSTSSLEWTIPEPMRRLLKKALTTRPRIDKGKCQLCLMCQTACPAGVIDQSGDGLKINYRDCIRCFCCQEVCPVGAIDVVEGWLLKYLG